jgi:hypothetical protein
MKRTLTIRQIQYNPDDTVDLQCDNYEYKTPLEEHSFAKFRIPLSEAPQYHSRQKLVFEMYPEVIDSQWLEGGELPQHVQDFLDSPVPEMSE